MGGGLLHRDRQGQQGRDRLAVFRYLHTEIWIMQNLASFGLIRWQHMNVWGPSLPVTVKFAVSVDIFTLLIFVWITRPQLFAVPLRTEKKG